MKSSWIFSVLALTVAAIDLLWILPVLNGSDVVWSDLWWRLVLAVAPIVLLVLLYGSVIKPVNAVVNGMDLLRGQDFSTRLARVGQPDADTLVGVFNSMMDRLKTERLRNMEQNSMLRQIIDVSPAGIAISDYDGNIVEMNRTMASYLGFSRPAEAFSRRFEDLDSPLAAAVSRVNPGQAEILRVGDANVMRCTRMWFMNNGFRRSFVMLEELTDEVMRAEREAYGRVIRIISHEVNNTLTGVGSILGLVGELPAVKSDEVMSDALESCQERCQGLGRFIRSYAEVVKIPDANLQPVDLADSLRSIWPFLEGMAPATVDMEFCCEDTTSVKADTVLLEQVMVNVVKNAVESIGDRPDGRVKVSVGGSPVKIEVVDNGGGISPEASRHLFAPFFSTKPGGRGLGLMFVADILEKHGCAFSLRTDPDGALTRFVVQFPR